MNSQNRYLNVDIDALSRCSYHCTLCKSGNTCCCAQYEISVSARKIQTIIGVLPLAAKYCSWLKTPQGFKNVFDKEDSRYVIETQENGRCVFAFRSPAGTLCSLHCVALHMGVRPSSLKPTACILWPLAVSDRPNQRLSICDDAYEFPCNRRTRKRRRLISGDLLDIIEDLFGASARKQIADAARNGLHHIKIPLRGTIAGEL